MIRTVTLAVVAAALAACGGRWPKPSPKPAWVDQGSGIYKTPQGTVVYGVGVIDGITSANIARTAADDRALIEAMKVVRAHEAALGSAFEQAASTDTARRARAAFTKAETWGDGTAKIAASLYKATASDLDAALFPSGQDALKSESAKAWDAAAK